MDLRTLHPGDRLTWRHVPRGGWGYVFPVDVVVVSVGRKRVLVEAPLARGGTKRVRVSPEALQPRPSTSTQENA